MNRLLIPIFFSVTLVFFVSVSGALAASYAPEDLGFNLGVNSNPHNLSNASTNAIKAASTGDNNETRVCVFCHTPHGATPQSTLWGRPDPAGMGSFLPFDETRVVDTSTLFGISDPGIVGTTLYANNTAPNEYPNGESKLCLSCHDGVTSIGLLSDNTLIAMTFDTLSAGGSTFYWDAAGSTGLDFSLTHPVSFVYDASVVTFLNGYGKVDSYSLPVAGGPAPLDNQSRVQCTTCHDPHKDTRGNGHTYPFWRHTTAATDALDYSETCQACHTLLLDPSTSAPPGTGMHDI